MSHKSGFVNIVGSPNVGKSTLMNRLVGEKLSIVTSKAQTTRHRILGIVNDENYQIVFPDTPGVVNAAYKLHEAMMEYVNASLKDADVLIFITDTRENKMNHEETLEKIKKMFKCLPFMKMYRITGCFIMDESNAKSSSTTNTFAIFFFFAAFFWRSTKFSNAFLLKSPYTNTSGTNLPK